MEEEGSGGGEEAGTAVADVIVVISLRAADPGVWITLPLMLPLALS